MYELLYFVEPLKILARALGQQHAVLDRDHSARARSLEVGKLEHERTRLALREWHL